MTEKELADEIRERDEQYVRLKKYGHACRFLSDEAVALRFLLLPTQAQQRAKAKRLSRPFLERLVVRLAFEALESIGAKEDLLASVPKTIEALEQANAEIERLKEQLRKAKGQA